MASNVDQLLAGVAGGGLAQNTYLQQQAGDQDAQLRQQQLQAGQMQLKSVQDKQAREASYQHDVQSYFADPKPEALGQLMLHYPDKADQIKQTKAVLDEPQRQSQLTQFGSLYSAASNGRADLAHTLISNIQTADKANGIVDPEIDDALAQLSSTDPATQKTALKNITALTQVHLAALDPKYSESLTKLADKSFTLGENQQRFDGDGNLVASGTRKQEYLVVPEGGKAIPLNGAPSLGQEGGGQAVSGGAAAGTRGDVSRLINRDAGGGYVPPSVGTLGQFVSFGKSLNNRGAKSSSAGTYQINGTTMAEFGPKALGPDWKNAPFNADSQEKVGEAIFDWAKQQSNPAAALRGRWVSLSPQKAAQLVQGDWQQARGVIAQGETGGAPGSSATSAPGSTQQQSGDPAGTVYGTPKPPKPGDGPDPAANIVAGDLSTVPAASRAAVKAVAEGRVQPPRAGTRNGEAMLNMVTAFDPTFDAANAQSRIKTRVDFTSGKSAIARNALNTAMGHLMHLDGQADQLGNSSFPFLNAARRFGQTGIGQSEYTNFDQTKTAAASEMRKVFSNSSGGNLTELKEWESSLNSAGSPQQLHDAIRNGVTLMGSRLDALKDQYTTGMGRSDNVPAMLNPKVAAAAKQRFGIDLEGGTTPPTSTAAPVRISTPAQAAQLRPGTLYVAPDGKVRKR